MNVTGSCHCGNVTYEAIVDPAHVSGVDTAVTYGLRVGCIDQRRELPPQRQIWCRSALEWSMNIVDLPKRDRE